MQIASQAGTFFFISTARKMPSKETRQSASKTMIGQTDGIGETCQSLCKVERLAACVIATMTKTVSHAARLGQGLSELLDPEGWYEVG